MKLHGTCPKCKRGSMFESKYLPLLDVPAYAEFRPVETLAVCLLCGAGGVIKREMFNNGTVIKGEFWTMDEISRFKISTP